jgi:hypothetical protein
MWIDRCLMSHLEHLGDDDTTRMLYAVEVRRFDVIQHCNAGDATARRVRVTLSAKAKAAATTPCSAALHAAPHRTESVPPGFVRHSAQRVRAHPQHSSA